MFKIKGKLRICKYIANLLATAGKEYLKSQAEEIKKFIAKNNKGGSLANSLYEDLKMYNGIIKQLNEIERTKIKYEKLKYENNEIVAIEVEKKPEIIEINADEASFIYRILAAYLEKEANLYKWKQKETGITFEKLEDDIFFANSLLYIITFCELKEELREDHLGFYKIPFRFEIDKDNNIKKINI